MKAYLSLVETSKWRHAWPLHHLQLPQQGSRHLSGVFGVIIMPFGPVSEVRAGHQVLLQNVTVHVGIHVSLKLSSPVPAALMQPQTMMLPHPYMTVGKKQFSHYSSPGHRHTCWTPSEPHNFILVSSDHRTWFQ